MECPSFIYKKKKKKTARYLGNFLAMFKCGNREFTEKIVQEYFIFQKDALENTNIKNLKCFKFAECFVFLKISMESPV